jgi:hypothetical protein
MFLVQVLTMTVVVLLVQQLLQLMDLLVLLRGQVVAPLQAFHQLVLPLLVLVVRQLLLVD